MAIHEDDLAEGDETFKIQLGEYSTDAPQNAKYLNDDADFATATITDNDEGDDGSDGGGDGGDDGDDGGGDEGDDDEDDADVDDGTEPTDDTISPVPPRVDRSWKYVVNAQQ